MIRAGILIGLLLFALGGCGSDRYAEENEVPAYLVSVSAGEARGSGVLYREDGEYLYVLTAAHVAAGLGDSGQAAVRFFDGWEIACEDVTASGTADLALIRIPREQIPGRQRDSYRCVESDKESFDNLRAGDGCTAVGLATGLARHEGSILDTWIYMEDYGQYMIWADATVESGMSGGALLDGEGRLIGILSGGSEDGELAAVPLSLVLQFMLEYELGIDSGTSID